MESAGFNPQRRSRVVCTPFDAWAGAGGAHRGLGGIATHGWKYICLDPMKVPPSKSLSFGFPLALGLRYPFPIRILDLFHGC